MDSGLQANTPAGGLARLLLTVPPLLPASQMEIKKPFILSSLKLPLQDNSNKVRRGWGVLPRTGSRAGLFTNLGMACDLRMQADPLQSCVTRRGSHEDPVAFQIVILGTHELVHTTRSNCTSFVTG